MTRTKAQQAVIDNRGGTLLVSAAAGSGKTSVLVDRLLDRILKEGKRIDEFLIITFTKAAAEELRIRIGRSLAQALRNDPQNHHLRQQTVLLYHTQISTIHALCTSILREWGQEVPVDFTLCEDEDASLLMLQALNEVLELRYEQLRLDDPFSKLLDLLSAGRDDSRLMDIVLDVYARMQSHDNPDGWMDTQRTLLSLEGVDEAGQTPWGMLLLEDTAQVLSYWIQSLSNALDALKNEPSLLPYESSLKETLVSCIAFRDATEQGWNATAVACTIPFPRLKPIRNCENPLLQEQIKRMRNQCKATMISLSQRFVADSDSLLEDIHLLYPALLGLLDLVKDFSLRYARHKLRKGWLDFNDLEHKTVALLLNPDGSPNEIAQQVGKRFVEIMVDEYQDTNHVQNTIFSALSHQEQNFFFVGDVKQSIYRFRLADPTIFLEKYRRFVPYDLAKDGESRKILLSQNFRSRPEILDAVNRLFGDIMSRRLGEMDYTAEEALYPGGIFSPRDDCQTELHVLHFEDLTETQEGRQAGKHELEAHFIAKKIAKLMTNPFLVSDGDGNQRPIRPDDIAILLRSPGSVRHHYLKALRELQIPLDSENESAFFESTEVSVLLALLQVIDNPRQDVPLLAVLHSPLYAFDGEALAKLRLAGEGDLYTALLAASEQGNARCESFLSQLRAFRFEAVDKSCHELLQLLYDKTNALAVFSRMPDGEKRQENLLAFYDLACRFERSGHRGLFGFLYHVSKLREQGGRSLKRTTKDGGGVKLLSIHRSKGLEYPVVFLAGLGKRFNDTDMQKPVLFHSQLGLGPRGLDSERMVEFPTLPREAVALQLRREMLAEEMRLLYVAMTRAKEKLVMTCSLSYGESDLKKLGTSLSTPLDPTALGACSSVGQWILLSAMTRPEGAMLRRLAEVEEPLWEQSSDYPWQILYHGGMPATSKALATTSFADPIQTTPLQPSEIWSRLTWHYPYTRLSELPAKLTATDLVKNAKRAFQGQSDETTARPSFHRPRFATEQKGLSPAQKGTALHTAMQSISLSRTTSVSEIQEEIHRLRAQAFLTDQEASSIDPQQLYRFFASPLGNALTKAPLLHREFPFSVLLPAKDYYDRVPQEEHILFQGLIDCWFEEDDGITLLDFKSNRVSSGQVVEAAHNYIPQMVAYGLALTQMTGKPVRRKLIWFLYPSCAVSFEEDGSIKKVY